MFVSVDRRAFLDVNVCVSSSMPIPMTAPLPKRKTHHNYNHDQRQAVVDELRGEKEKLERAGALALRIQTLHSQEAPEKREGDAKAWTEFVATRLVPRLARDRERVGAGGYTQEERLAAMRATNPTFVLRNWVAQDAIEVRRASLWVEEMWHHIYKSVCRASA